MAKPDLAVRTARDVLNGTICECGCTEGSHATGAPPRPCGDCGCRDFRAVEFVVNRKS